LAGEDFAEGGAGEGRFGGLGVVGVFGGFGTGDGGTAEEGGGGFVVAF